MKDINNAKVEPSTLKDVTHEGENRWRRVTSVITLIVVALFVLTALVGTFDREAQVESKAGDTTVVMTYPSFTRGGNLMDLKIEVSSQQPLPETIELSINQDYLALGEGLVIYPDPESQSIDAQGNVGLELAVQPGSKKAVVRIVGSITDEWAPKSEGLVDVSMPGQPEHHLQLTTWRVL